MVRPTGSRRKSMRMAGTWRTMGLWWGRRWSRGAEVGPPSAAFRIKAPRPPSVAWPSLVEPVVFCQPRNSLISAFFLLGNPIPELQHFREIPHESTREKVCSRKMKPDKSQVWGVLGQSQCFSILRCPNFTLLSITGNLGWTKSIPRGIYFSFYNQGET